MSNIKKVLTNLNFPEKEIAVYLTALEKGPCSIQDLSNHSCVARAVCYQAIEGLESKDLIKKIKHGKRFVFGAEDPRKLMDYALALELDLKAKMLDLERALPELELRKGEGRPVVRFYEGKEGIRAYQEAVKNLRPDSIWEIGDLDAMTRLINSQELVPLRMDIGRVGAHIYGLYSRSKNFLKNPYTTVDGYLLPKEDAGFESNIAIHGDTVIVVTFGDKLNTIIVESKQLAKTLIILFRHAFKDIQRDQLKK